MTTTGDGVSTLGVLARQEMRNYLRNKLFWFGAGLTLAFGVVGMVHPDPGSTALSGIAPAALLGVLGLVVMNGLARRSDQAAAAAGTVAVPERTRTLALAAAALVPLGVALVAYVMAVVGYHAHAPADHTVPAGVSAAYVHAQQFGQGVMASVGGPLLGLLLARHLARRGVAALSAVLLVIITILLQGNFEGGQPYRVLWVWTYFVGPLSFDSDQWRTAPGNPFFWVLYLVALCVLGVILAVLHDRESEKKRVRRLAGGVVGAATVLGALTVAVGYTNPILNQIPLP